MTSRLIIILIALLIFAGLATKPTTSCQAQGDGWGNDAICAAEQLSLKLIGISELPDASLPLAIASFSILFLVYLGPNLFTILKIEFLRLRQKFSWQIFPRSPLFKAKHFLPYLYPTHDPEHS